MVAQTSVLRVAAACNGAHSGVHGATVKPSSLHLAIASSHLACHTKRQVLLFSLLQLCVTGGCCCELLLLLREAGVCGQRRFPRGVRQRSHKKLFGWC